MPTKSIATSATGPSWEPGEWKIKVLRETTAGVPCVFLACAFGVRPMAEMVRGGLFVRGFPPDSGDHIGLEIDGEVREFCVYRVRGEFHCEEVRESRGKARQRVRKALKLVVDKVKSQDAATGAALGESLGEGDQITFRPPPDWRL